MSSRARARVLSVLACLIMAFSVVPVTALESSGNAIGGGGRWNFKSVEKCVMRKINKVRAREGRSRLAWDKHLGVVARRHAKSMAANYSVFHDYNMDSEVTHWRALAQNSGSAGSCKRAFWSFMRSSTHRSNMLGRWRHMGVGVERRNGRIFVQEIFEWRADPGNVYRYP